VSSWVLVNDARKDPLKLASGPITQSKAKKFQASMALHIQEEISKELQDYSFEKMKEELEERPRFIMVLETCKGDKERHFEPLEEA